MKGDFIMSSPLAPHAEVDVAGLQLPRDDVFSGVSILL